MAAAHAASHETRLTERGPVEVHHTGQTLNQTIGEVFERIELLYALNVHKHLDDLSGLIVRRYGTPPGFKGL